MGHFSNSVPILLYELLIDGFPVQRYGAGYCVSVLYLSLDRLFALTMQQRRIAIIFRSWQMPVPWSGDSRVCRTKEDRQVFGHHEYLHCFLGLGNIRAYRGRGRVYIQRVNAESFLANI